MAGDTTERRAPRAHEETRSSSEEIAQLHDRCGVYTRGETVRWLLDAAGWTPERPLWTLRLLEPSAGDGAFVLEAAERLLASMRTHGQTPSATMLCPVVSAFEIHPGAAETARQNVIDLLSRRGLSETEAREVASTWIRTEDFLLAEAGGADPFTHVVGNPPYIRWSKLPRGLRRAYEDALPADVARGDLFLPFIDRGLDLLRDGGILAFLCSDRWLRAAFSDRFRRRRAGDYAVLHDVAEDPRAVFRRDVDAYPTKLVLRRGAPPASAPAVASSARSLKELGCRIRVGPALGPDRVFVIEGEAEVDVEPELLRPWVRPSEIGDDGRVASTGARVVTMFDEAGRLRDLADYPLLSARLERFRTALERRAFVRAGAPWYRTIDRTMASDWLAPKLLVPEIAREPRFAVDKDGHVPAHSVYAIFPGEGLDVDALATALGDGVLARELARVAPRAKGGYVRAYKRFLEEVRVSID